MLHGMNIDSMSQYSDSVEWLDGAPNHAGRIVVALVDWKFSDYYSASLSSGDRPVRLECAVRSGDKHGGVK